MPTLSATPGARALILEAHTLIREHLLGSNKPPVPPGTTTGDTEATVYCIWLNLNLYGRGYIWRHYRPEQVALAYKVIRAAGLPEDVLCEIGSPTGILYTLRPARPASSASGSSCGAD